MPILKEYVQQYSAPLSSGGSANFVGREMTAADISSSGNDLYTLGTGMIKAADIIEKKNEQEEVSRVHNEMAKAQADWTENFIARTKSAQPGDKEFTPTLMGDMDEYFSKMSGNYSTKAGKRVFSEQVSTLKSHFSISSVKYQSALAGEHAKLQFVELGENLGRTAFNDPTQYEMLLQKADKAIDDPNSFYSNLDSVSRMEMKQKIRNSIDLATVKGLATHSPEFLLSSVAPDVMKKFKPTADALVKNGVVQKADFKSVMDVVFQHEGGYVNDPQDKGGETNFGISKKANPDIDVKNLTRQDAEKIYKERYWNAIGADKLTPAAALVAMDIAVLSGVGAAKKYIEETGGDPQAMLDKQRQFLTTLASNPKGDYAKFGNGWMKRMDDLQGKIATMPTPATVVAESNVIPVESQTPAVIGIKAFDNLTWKEQYETIHNAEQTVRTNRAFDSHNRTEAEYQRKKVQDEAMNQYLNRVMDGDTTIMRDIRNDARLDFAHREHVINMVNVKAGKMDNTDAGVFIDTYQKIHSGVITSEDQINGLMGKGLSITDVGRLRNELVGKNQPLGEIKKQFFSMAKSVISESSMIKNDPIGDEQYYKWMQDVDSIIKDKQSKGVTLSDMLNPNSKEYLGWTISKYERTIRQQSSDYANRVMKQGVSKPLTQPGFQAQPAQRPSLDQIFAGNR